jgi:ribonuclease III
MSESTLLARIGYTFNQPALLQEALTHRSFSAIHNERLEFLGDSVLNCAIAQALFRRFPRLSEGELSRLRAGLVNKDTLVSVALELDIGPLIRLGEGEQKSGGQRRPSILADALEAVFGAVFRDGGYGAAESVVLKLFEPHLERLDPAMVAKDPKTLLQEYLQGRRLPLPKYSIVETRGEAHEQMFRVECVIEKLHMRTEGEGLSRRLAEQQAAAQAYRLIAHG